MVAKLLLGIAVSFVSVSCAAQVVPAAGHPRLAPAVGVGMNYWRGDWGTVARWGPDAWASVTIWHDFSLIAEGHSIIAGGSQLNSNYKYFAGGGGLLYTSDYWGRLQPLLKAEAGYASLSHPPNLSGHLHDTGNVWTLGGGFEYHTWGQLWTRVEYDYDFFPHIHSGITSQNNTLNPAGITFGETFRFGPSGSRF